MQGYLGSLGDLNHSHPFVQQQMLSFVTGLVEDYSVDAFRLDTVVYVDLNFVKEVQQVSWRCGMWHLLSLGRNMWFDRVNMDSQFQGYPVKEPKQPFTSC